MKYYIVITAIISLMAAIVNIIRLGLNPDSSKNVSTAVALAINLIMVIWGIMLLIN